MSEEAFLPKSPNFNVHWTGAKVDAVGSREVWALLGELLPAEETTCKLRFLRIFGNLTSKSEEYDMMDMRHLQFFHRSFWPFRHSVYKHWLDIARMVATDMVPPEPQPIVTLRSDVRGAVKGLCMIGLPDAMAMVFPDENLQDSLDLKPLTTLREGLHAILNLDFRGGWQDRYQAAFRTGWDLLAHCKWSPRRKVPEMLVHVAFVFTNCVASSNYHGFRIFGVLFQVPFKNWVFRSGADFKPRIHDQHVVP